MVDSRYRATGSGANRVAGVPIGKVAFPPDEAPTVPTGRVHYDRLLLRYAWEMSAVDRACLLRNAEAWAARNRK